MKITIDKSNLISALDKAMRAVSTRTSVPILEGVLLEAESDILKISGDNREMGIQATAKCEVLRPGSAVVNAKLFLDVVRKLGDEIDMTINGSELTIESGNSINKIKFLDANMFPSLDPIDAKGGEFIDISQKDLKDLISKTVFAVSTDETRGVLMGEQITISGGQMEIVAVDGFRFAVRRVKTNANDFETIIPGITLTEISKIFGSGDIRIYKNGNAVMFEAEDFFITTSTLNGEFISYKNVVDQEAICTLEVSLKDFKSAVEAVFPFVPYSDYHKNPAMIVEVLKDKMLVRYDSDIGQSNNEISVNFTGEELRRGFNPKYVLEALRAIDEEKVILEFLGKNLMTIKPLEGNEFLYACLAVMFREVSNEKNS